MNEFTIESAADLEEHIRFIKRLLEDYFWGKERSGEILRLLKLIEQKHNDPILYLSITGEFSTGKSTFINALVGEEILEISPIQGTTTAITLIKYNPTRKLTVTTKNDGAETEKTIISEDDDDYSYEAFKSEIVKYTSFPEYTENTVKTSVYLPSKFLENGIVIIDTPGTNALERWHEEVTKRAMNELSDVSIILTSALSPLPASQLKFIRDNIEKQLPYSTFVVSFVDGLHKNELNPTLKFIKAKVKKEFSIESPEVLPYAAPFVISGDKASEYYQLSKQTEEKLTLSLKHRRTVFEYKAMTEILGIAIKNIGKSFEHTLKSFDEFEKILMNKQFPENTVSTVFDIYTFFGKIGDLCPRSLINSFDYHISAFDFYCETEWKNAKKEFSEDIFPQIESYTPHGFAKLSDSEIFSVLSKQLDEFVKFFDKKYGERIYKTAKLYLDGFCEQQSITPKLLVRDTVYEAYELDDNIKSEDDRILIKKFFAFSEAIIKKRLDQMTQFYSQKINRFISAALLKLVSEKISTEQISEAFSLIQKQRKCLITDNEELKNRLFTIKNKSELLEKMN